jgi:hypothetical protein
MEKITSERVEANDLDLNFTVYKISKEEKYVLHKRMRLTFGRNASSIDSNYLSGWEFLDQVGKLDDNGGHILNKDAPTKSKGCKKQPQSQRPTSRRGNESSVGKVVDHQRNQDVEDSRTLRSDDTNEERPQSERSGPNSSGDPTLVKTSEVFVLPDVHAKLSQMDLWVNPAFTSDPINFKESLETRGRRSRPNSQRLDPTLPVVREEDDQTDAHQSAKNENRSIHSIDFVQAEVDNAQSAADESRERYERERREVQNIQINRGRAEQRYPNGGTRTSEKSRQSLASQYRKPSGRAGGDKPRISNRSPRRGETYRLPKIGKWREARDERSGRSYWYHTGTRKTSWDPPKASQSTARRRRSRRSEKIVRRAAKKSADKRQQRRTASDWIDNNFARQLKRNNLEENMSVGTTVRVEYDEPFRRAFPGSQHTFNGRVVSISMNDQDLTIDFASDGGIFEFSRDGIEGNRYFDGDDFAAIITPTRRQQGNLQLQAGSVNKANGGLFPWAPMATGRPSSPEWTV